MVDPAAGTLYGARYGLGEEFSSIGEPSREDVLAAQEPLGAAWPRNTVLIVVATDAALAKNECCRVAMASHDGLARAVTPVHCMTDGDVVFSLATGKVPLPTSLAGDGIDSATSRVAQLDLVMAAAANVVTRAIVHATLAATSVPGWSCYLDRYPSARR